MGEDWSIGVVRVDKHGDMQLVSYRPSSLPEGNHFVYPGLTFEALSGDSVSIEMYFSNAFAKAARAFAVTHNTLVMTDSDPERGRLNAPTKR